MGVTIVALFTMAKRWKELKYSSLHPYNGILSSHKK
jgi:hypothetical protein